MATNHKFTVKTRLFNLSSESADIMYNGSMKSWGTWTIPNFINYDETISNIYFRISHAEVPNSFYLVNARNNRLAIYSGTSVTNYDVPFGNYNVKTLVTALKLLVPTSFNFTYNSVTNKFTMTNTTSFYVVASGSTITKIMGLSSNTDMTATPTLGVYILPLPYIASFLPTARLNFRSSSMQLDNYHSNDHSNDVFLSMQNNSMNETMILYHNYTQLQHLVTVNNLNTLDIRITDDSNDVIDFNNIDWYLTIRIDVHYYMTDKTTNFTNIVKSNNQLLSDTLEPDPLDEPN
jgi:hypothetical protein